MSQFSKAEWDAVELVSAAVDRFRRAATVASQLGLVVQIIFPGPVMETTRVMSESTKITVSKKTERTI